MHVNKTQLSIAMANSGMNFKDLAEKSEVSRATLSYINNGKSCRASVLFKIAKALNVTVNELV